MAQVAAESVITIPGLPEALFCVPEAPDRPDDPQGARKRQEWVIWSKKLHLHRIKTTQKLDADARFIPYEMQKCRLSPAYFMAMYGQIFEPRHEPEYSLIGGDKPWLPFAIQVEMLAWLDACMEAGGPERDGIVSKCRTMGATWTMCCWIVHGWLFKYPWNVLLSSRNQSLVDSKSDDSMFAKIEFILDYLPEWMLPKGFNLKDKRYNSELILINPENRTQIKGESTNSNIGRSGRYSCVVIDEAAFVPGLSDVWAGLRATTSHRFAISSESLKEGPDFHNLGVNNPNPIGRKPALFEMDWWHHPLHDSAWLENEKASFEGSNNLNEFYQEYLRDARAGDDQWVYPYAMNLTIDPTVGLIEMGHLYASIDPGFRDSTAIVWIQEQGDKYATIAAYENRGKPAAFYGTIITGVPDYEAGWSYSDRDREFMEFTASLPQEYLHNYDFYGDFLGKSVTGATLDSFYSILEREYDIHINKDRDAIGGELAAKPEMRTHKFRREALREILPTFIFAADHNAPYALKCLQENKFPPETGKSQTEAKAALHNQSSHMTTAYEYWACHRRNAHALIDISLWRAKQRQERNRRDLSTSNPNFRDYGRLTRPAGTR